MQPEELQKFANDKRVVLNCLIPENLSKKEFGQLYTIILNPSIIVGNHYHKEKEEFLMVIKGKAKVYLENLKTKEKKEIILDSEKPSKLKIPPFYAHAVENHGSDEAILLEYSSEEFNPDKEDKVFYSLKTD